jgi:hypothetical protein
VVSANYFDAIDPAYQVAISLAQLDHDSRTDHVQDELRSCASLHPRTSSDNFWTGHSGDQMIRIAL